MTAAAASNAILADEASALFAILEPYDALVLAVSGGGDSLALLHLVGEWAGRPARVHVVTVDHAMRAESAAEAVFTGAAAHGLGLPHTTLRWAGAKPVSGLISAARDARYGLLTSFAENLATSGKAAVVTAHHADDQIETLIMRLARGSGISGLTGMAPVRPLGQSGRVDLVRPFLAVGKERLLASLSTRGKTWIDDPTNLDNRYERVRARSALAALKTAGLDLSQAVQSAGRLRRADAALSFAADELTAAASGIFAHETATALTALDRDIFAAAPEEIRLRVLANAIGRHGGLSPQPQLSELEDLVHGMARHVDRSRVTLGGCVISTGTKIIRIYREFGRITHTLTLKPGESGVWDGRYRITARQSAAVAPRQPLIVQALGPQGLAALPHQERAKLAFSAAVAHALPAVFEGEELRFTPYVHAQHNANFNKTADFDVCAVEPLRMA